MCEKWKELPSKNHLQIYMLANYFDYLPTLKILSHRPHSVIGPWQLFKISDPSALSPPYGSQHNNQHLVPLGSKQTHSSICALDIHCRHKISFLVLLLWFSFEQFIIYEKDKWAITAGHWQITAYGRFHPLCLHLRFQRTHFYQWNEMEKQKNRKIWMFREHWLWGWYVGPLHRVMLWLWHFLPNFYRIWETTLDPKFH